MGKVEDKQASIDGFVSRTIQQSVINQILFVVQIWHSSHPRLTLFKSGRAPILKTMCV